MYDGQKGTQQLLLFFAFVSVPVMLLAHPLYLKSKVGHAAPEVSHQVDYDNSDEDDDHSDRRKLAPVAAAHHGHGGHGNEVLFL
jgi:hypothetical protein